MAELCLCALNDGNTRTMEPLQCILNVAARLALNLCLNNHITPLICLNDVLKPSFSEEHIIFTNFIGVPHQDASVNSAIQIFLLLLLTSVTMVTVTCENLSAKISLSLLYMRKLSLVNET